jgi:hypothetical protein
MNRLIVLNRFFYPDHSATSQILTDLRMHFAALAWTCMSLPANSFMTIPRGNCRPKATTAQMRTFRAAERNPPPPPSNYVD